MCQINSQGTHGFASPGKHEWAIRGVHRASDWKVVKGSGSSCTSGEDGSRTLFQTLVLSAQNFHVFAHTSLGWHFFYKLLVLLSTAHILHILISG
jgi:hypothetical protein